MGKQAGRAAGLALLALCGAAVLLQRSAPPTATQGPTNSAQASRYGSLALHFEPNRGQLDSEVRFTAHGDGYRLFLTDTEAVLAASIPISQLDAPAVPTRLEPTPAARRAVVRMKMLGSNPSPTARGLEPLPGRSHYLRGNDPNAWRTNVPHYRRVRFDGVYPGIAVEYYEKQRQIEYDFIVEPHANPSDIRFAFEGVGTLRWSDDDALIYGESGSELRLSEPFVYQTIDGRLQQIESRYAANRNGELTFELAEYRSDLPLVIDPVLGYSTLLRGGGDDNGGDIDVDGKGDAYVIGTTESLDFPVSDPMQPQNAGGQDVFVSKVNATGSLLIYSTYLGGSMNEFGDDIVVDGSGNAYIGGRTFSDNFPVVSALQPVSLIGLDGFVAKLDPTGSSLLFSTYLGGNGRDAVFGIDLDSDGDIYVTGNTDSTNFPVAAAFQPMLMENRDKTDAFVTRMTSDGSRLVYSTYFGGTETESASAIAVDGDGNAHITGTTFSDDFPTVNPIQPALNGSSDAYLTTFSPAGGPLFSTFLGGSKIETGFGIDTDSDGNAYLIGRSLSADFPVVNALQPALSNPSNSDAFVTKYNLGDQGPGIAYSTYLGTPMGDSGFDIAVDSQGHAHITGIAGPGFPLVDPLPEVTFDRGMFVAEIGGAGTPLVFSSYLSFNAFGKGIAVDARGGVYVTGELPRATSLPFTPGAIDPRNPRRPISENSFVSKIADEAVFLSTVSAASFSGTQFAPGAIVSGFGVGVAAETLVSTELPLPTNLGGTAIVVRDSEGEERESSLFFVSDRQANYLIPEGTAEGRATATVIRSGVAVIAGELQIQAVAPSLFSADASGTGVAAATFLRVRADNSRESGLVFDPANLQATPIDLGPEGDQVFLVLFGTGFRNAALADVNLRIGAVTIPALFAGAAPGFAGLDQVNAGPLPRILLQGETVRRRSRTRTAQGLRLRLLHLCQPG